MWSLGLLQLHHAEQFMGFFEVMPEAILFLVALTAVKVHNWIKFFFLPTCSALHSSSGINLAALSGSELDINSKSSSGQNK